MARKYCCVCGGEFGVDGEPSVGDSSRCSACYRHDNRDRLLKAIDDPPLAMSDGEQGAAGYCDLCGRPKAEYNNACPQHRMWKFEAELKQTRIECERLRDLYIAAGTANAGMCRTLDESGKRREQLEVENEKLRQALMDIAHPIERFKRKVEESKGELRLDGHYATMLAESAGYLRGIAVNALYSESGEGKAKGKRES